MRRNDLKKLSLLLRIPRMTDSFQKAVRKRKTAEELKRYEKEAIQYMSNLIDFNNEVVFYENLAEHVDKNYNNHEALG